MCSDFSKNKLIIIGIDGGTFDVILPLINQGKLPHLAQLMQGGTWGELRSTIHPITPQAWSSFMTGKSAGKHGIYDFTAPAIGQYGVRIVNAASRKAKTFFALLSENGREVGAVNIPFTYPPEKVKGFMISGFDAPKVEPSICSPQELYPEITDRFGRYLLHETFPIGKRYDLKSYRSSLARSIQYRLETSRYLLQHRPCDLFMTVFNDVDHVQHVFWRDMEKKDPLAGRVIPETYEETDRAIGELLKEVGPDNTVMIMSDHGSGGIEHLFYLDNWLRQERFLTYQSNESPNKVLARNWTRSVRSMAKRLLSTRVRKYIKSKMPGFRDRVESYLQSSKIDWSSTYAYSMGMYGNIYVNLKGREPNGIVNPGQEYEDVLARLTERLLSLKDPENKASLVDRVYRKEELYSGSCMNGAPDLIIHWKDYAVFTKKGIDSDDTSCCFGNGLKIEASGYPHTGTHRLNGMFIINGPNIRKNQQIRGLMIMDLAPTILYMMNTPIPEDMDGHVVTDLFDPEFTSRQAPQYCPGEQDTRVEEDLLQPLAENEQKEVEARLRSLGYLD